MKKILLLLPALSLCGTTLFAQYIRCGADAHQASLEATDPHFRMQREAAVEMINRLAANQPEYKSGAVVTIPVVFHIIYNNSAQNIPDARIYEQIDVLNDDYARTNVDAVNTRSMFQQVAANTQIQFCLAQQTPNGAATNGILRIQNPGTTFPNNPHTVSPEWNHTKYLNIYVGNLGGGLLGYANLPPGSTGNDHVVVLYSAVGGPNNPGTANPYHLGRTATHEVGHWLNLQHTFQGGCGGLNNNTCTSGGDFVCDTPPVASPNFGCPVSNPNSCTEVAPFPAPYSSNMVDMYENYMDYTDDNCMNAFTSGQSSRMNLALTSLRSALLTSPGCVPVGISEVLDPSYISVGPNPSSDWFHVQFNFPAVSDVELTVSDMAGRIIHQSQHNTGLTSIVNLDMSEHTTGVYQLAVNTSKGRLVKRISVVR